MGKSHSSGGINLASCIVAAIFLIILAAIAFAVYFTTFRPKDPKLSVNAVALPAFSVANSTASFNFSQYVTVHNPNRAVFTHYDSSLQLLHGGSQVGLMFIPAGKIGPGNTQYMAATFSVKSFPLSVSGQPVSVGPIAADGLDGFRSGPSMELESRLEMVGRVRVLHFFTHHVEATADCTVAVAVTDGSVLGVRC